MAAAHDWDRFEWDGMKKKFPKLSKREQEKVEAAYHRMNPEDPDEAMSRQRAKVLMPFGYQVD